MFQTLLTITPLFLIIFGSALLVKLKLIKEHWAGPLNAFALSVGLPALVLSTLSKHTFSLTKDGTTILVNAIFILSVFLLTLLFSYLLRLKKPLRRTLFLCAPFGNVAFLGVPIIYSVLGEKALPTASILIAVYLFLVFTIAIGYLEYSLHGSHQHAAKETLKKIAINPILLAAVIGIGISFFHLPIPKAIVSAIDMLASSVTPVVLVVIGIFIGSSSIGKIKEWIPVGIFSLFTLLLLPGLFIVFLFITGFSLSTHTASVIDAAMPLAITPFALADQYRLEKQFIARAIVLSTVLSVITVPFWIAML